MRIRVLGQVVPVSLAYLAVYAAVSLRFESRISDLPRLAQELGLLWPRALLFSGIVVICLLAFGLYSSRQREQITEMVLRGKGAR